MFWEVEKTLLSTSQKVTLKAPLPRSTPFLNFTLVQEKWCTLEKSNVAQLKATPSVRDVNFTL